MKYPVRKESQSYKKRLKKISGFQVLRKELDDGNDRLIK